MRSSGGWGGVGGLVLGGGGATYNNPKCYSNVCDCLDLFSRFPWGRKKDFPHLAPSASKQGGRRVVVRIWLFLRVTSSIGCGSFPSTFMERLLSTMLLLFTIVGFTPVCHGEVTRQGEFSKNPIKNFPIMLVVMWSMLIANGA